MTQEKFREELADILGVEEEAIKDDAVLESFEQWDSLSVLTMLDLYDEMELDLEVEAIDSSKTIGDLIKLAHFS